MDELSFLVLFDSNFPVSVVSPRQFLLGAGRKIAMSPKLDSFVYFRYLSLHMETLFRGAVHKIASFEFSFGLLGAGRTIAIISCLEVFQGWSQERLVCVPVLNSVLVF